MKKFSNEFSISGYTKKTVINQLTKSFNSRDYKLACYYSVQMHCSNWLIDWWLTILIYSAKILNVNNPKIGKFLLTIQRDFPDLLKTGSNTPEIREVIALVAGVLTFSPKDVPLFNLKSMEENESKTFLSSIENTRIHFIVEKESLPTDSQLIMKILSKFVESMLNLNMQESLRLLGLCLFLEKNKKFKEKIQCGRRNWNGMSDIQKRDWIFLLWDILLNLSTKENRLYEVISSWRLLYAQNYLLQKKSSLWCFVTHSIILITNPIDFNLNCVHNEEIINKGCSLIDSLYLDILKQKQNQIKVIKSN